jgi:periplasmic protein TonB
MAKAPGVGSLVLAHEARRAGMALPLSLCAHAAFIAALMLVPRAERAALPEVASIAQDALVLRVARADPPPAAVVIAPPAAVPRPPRAPALAAPATAPVTAPPVVGQVAVPLVEPDGPPVGDGCVGCVIGTTAVEPVPGGGNGDPRTATGTGGGGGQAPLPIGGQITAPIKLRNVDPAYPALARQAGVQGRVVIECVIDTEGRVVRTRVLEGPPLLREAALAAVSQWRYRPTLLNGTPVAVIMTVRLDFRLR